MFAKAIGIPLLLAIALLPSLASATSGDKGATASNGIVSGTVKDTAGAVLQGAQISLQPTAITVASDAQGNFVIPNLVPGTYTVTISYVGFNNSVSTVEVKAGQTTPLNATMTIGSSNQQVLVNANLVGDALAINEQRTSANILNVETDTQIQSLPNANVADATGRLPGVTHGEHHGVDSGNRESVHRVLLCWLQACWRRGRGWRPGLTAAWASQSSCATTAKFTAQFV